MLQLRLWLTVVVIVVTGALVLLIGTSAMYERVMLPFEQIAGQSVAAANGVLTKHGADSVDAATRASIDDAVRAAAKKGEMTPEAEAVLLNRAGAQGAPAFALLVKPDGNVAARAGAEVKVDGPVTGLPEFAEAATGIARDGLQFFDGKPFHVAAAPIFDGANLASVLLLGWPYDASFADRVSQQVGAPVVVVIKDARLGSALADVTMEQLKARGAGVGNLDLGALPGFLPLLVPDHGRYMFGSVPVFGGESTFAVVVGTDRNEAFRALAFAQALVLGGTLVLALLQVLLIVTTLRAVNKPIEVIVNHLSQVSQGNSVGILPEAALTGQFLRLGKQVNMILQMTPSAGRPGAPLGSLGGAGLGSANSPLISSPPVPTPSLGGPPAGDDEAFPGVSTTPRGPAGQAGVSNPPSSSASIGDFNLGTGPTAQVKQSPATSSDPPSGLSNLFEDGPDPLAAFRVQPKPPSSPPAPANGNGAPAPTPAPPPAASMQPEATVMFQVPAELLNQSAQASNMVPPPSKPAPTPSYVPPKQADDARTVVAAVPQELLSAVSGAARDGVNAADEAHYKEVYDKFVQTRLECGEDTSDLTYDRFVAKLLKNRQQIVEKHKAKSVRFQVYVKEGKAALRALPVRE
jgi:hypothetical protein